MRWCVLLAAAVLAAAPGIAQQPSPAVRPARPVNPGLARLRSAVNPEFPVWGPAYTMERVAEHLASLPEELRKYVRYLDMSQVPRAKLPYVVSGALFTVPSMSTAPTVERLRAVPTSDQRLFWLDLRWYCWTAEAWEKVSLEDPYFREPIIPSNSPALRFVRTTIGNGVLRADWLLYYGGDTSQFLKAGEVKADNAFYYTLTYAEREVRQKVKVTKQVPKQVVKYDNYGRGYYTTETTTEEQEEERVVRGVPPQNAAEFEQFWKVDLILARQRQADRGGIVEHGTSVVSYNNRVLSRVQGPFGGYWRTYDVFRTSGDQDFLEQLPTPPQHFDAGEHIAIDQKGAQHYFLSNGKGERVEFGDPRVVHDRVSGERDIVITWKSCVACHTQGIIEMKNELPQVLEEGVDLKAQEHRRQEIKAFYLSNINRLARRDQDDYTEFVRDCNGLSPQENANQLAAARDWYAAPLSLDQAAREVGARDARELADAVSLSPKARLGRLILSGKPIPRVVWEQSGYAEAALLLLEYRKAAGVPASGK